MEIIRLQNQKGFSITEAIVAAGLIALTALSVGYVYTESLKNTAAADTTRDALYLHSGTLARMKQILLDVSTTGTKGSERPINTLGLCNLVTSEALTYGIGEIKMDFGRQRLAALLKQPGSSKDRWALNFEPDWIAEKDRDECKDQDEFKRCFSPSKNYEQDGALRGVSDILLVAQIKPVDLSPENSQPFTEIPDFRSLAGAKAIDVKRVAFYLESALYYNKRDGTTGKDVRKKSVNKELVWAADVGYCTHTLASGAVVELYPSGAGLGDSEGVVVYNNPDFFRNITLDPLKDSAFKRIVVQEGKIDQAGFIRTDPEKNVEIACTENLYRCYNKDSKRAFSSRLNADVDIKYANGYKGANHPQIAFTPRLSLQRERTGTDYVSSKKVDVDYFLAGVLYRKNQADGFYYAFDDVEKKLDLNKPMALKPTTNILNVTLNDQTGGMCAEICPSVAQRGAPPAYFAKLDITLHHLFYNASSKKSDDYNASLAATAPTACIVCYAKNCSRLGLATFGRIDQQPLEPIDATIPECALNDSEAKDISLQNIELESTNSDRCIAAQIIKGRSELKYSVRSCDEKLPVMCFGYGNFTVATDISTTKATWSAQTYADSQRRCYEMSAEKVQVEKFREMFNQAGVTNIDFSELATEAIGETSYYSFFNNSNQAIFMAPQNDSQVVSAIENLLGKVSYPNEKPFWIALKTDGGGFPVSAVPLMQTKNLSSDATAIYFNGNTPVLRTYSWESIAGDLNPNETGTSYGLLAHHIRFKGVIPHGRISKKAFKFLCRSSDGRGQFASQQQSSNWMSGYEACAKEGGLYVPPLTPLQWAQAYKLANDFDVNFSYPNPEESPGYIWIGAVSNNGFASYFIPTRDNNVSENDSFFNELFKPYKTITGESSTTGFLDKRGRHLSPTLTIKVWEQKCTYEKGKKGEPDEKVCVKVEVEKEVDRKADYQICHNSSGSDWKLIQGSDSCVSRGMRKLSKNVLGSSVVAQIYWLILTKNLKEGELLSKIDSIDVE